MNLLRTHILRLLTVMIFEGRAYAIVTGEHSYSTALSRASQMRYRGLAGHLATITSEREYNFLYWTMNARDVWIALSDASSDGVWKHTAGPDNGKPALSSNFTLWAFGQPNGGTRESCAFVDSGGYADDTCSYRSYGYIIEFECLDTSSPQGRCNRMSLC